MIETRTVVAEDAPIGVQLWPTTGPQHADNFTLADVSIVRRVDRDVVVWLYRNGKTRTFNVGEEVAIAAQ
jgi:hypothetical protein